MDNNNNNNNNSGSNNKNIPIVVPYMHRLGERLKRTCNMWLSRYTSEGPTPSKSFYALKDSDNKSQKYSVYIQVQMHSHQLQRGVHRGIRQILWLPVQGTPQDPIPYSPTQSFHRIPSKPQLFTIVNRESQGITKNIKKVMYIRLNDPSLSRNLAKYQLLHIWDQVQDTHHSSS